MLKRIYLDYAATTPLHPEVFKAMKPYLLENFGNPSTLYSYGQEARQAVENSRGKIAGLIHAKPEEIVFTSGGTEANNLAIKGVAQALGKEGNHIITCAIEHHSVLGPCQALENRGFAVTYLPVNEYGQVNPENVGNAITQNTILISIMHANNEIGTLQPVAEIGRLARQKGIYFHTDAVQTFGHIPVDVEDLGVDLLSASAHKIYGPKGVGALYIREGVKLEPLIDGGEQEDRRRAGTENVPGITGFGRAVELAEADMPGEAQRLTELRNRFIKGLQATIEDIHLNGHPSARLPGNVNVSINYVEGEAVCLNLDLENICAATGSACTTGSVEPSHVVLALGKNRQLAHGSVRFTMGKWTTGADIDRVKQALPGIVARLRSMSPLYRQDRH
ncbi:MAG: cysteine desulfurase NifS [Dehalococcoidaceae bacterium]|nr:cysteine desulfurase NifS [Dehalococcoidaceae bacterium]